GGTPPPRGPAAQAPTRESAAAPADPPSLSIQDLADREPLVKAGLEIFKARLVGHKRAPAK
ncbi:MAG: hypothetical protein AAB368_12495, partial [bacterium]